MPRGELEKEPWTSMDHETALAESGKLVAPSRHHDIPGPSSHDDDESNDMARRGGRQFAMQTGCRRDAGHGSPFSLPPLPAYSFSCILNCTKKQGTFFFLSQQAACMYFYGLRMRRHEPSDATAVFGRRGERWGDMAGGKGSQKRCATGVPRMAFFFFSFSHLDKAFPAVFSVHWGQQQKRTRGQQTEGSRTLWEGQGKQANPEAWVFYSDHMGSGSRMRSGTGSKQQAEGIWALVWPWEPVVGGMGLRRWRPHCIIVYGIWEHEEEKQFSSFHEEQKLLPVGLRC